MSSRRSFTYELRGFFSLFIATILVACALVTSKVAAQSTIVTTPLTQGKKNWALSSLGASIPTVGLVPAGITPAELIDGIDTRNFVAGVDQSVLRAPLEIDLGDLRSIDEIRFSISGQGKAAGIGYTVSVKAALSDPWELIIDRSQGGYAGNQVITFEEKELRFVQIAAVTSIGTSGLRYTGDIAVLGKEVQTPTPDFTVQLTPQLNGSFETALKKELAAGIYEVTFLGGAFSRFATDDENEGRTWQSSFHIDVGLSGLSYAQGFLNDRFSVFPTKEASQAKMVGNTYTIMVPFSTTVHFWVDAQQATATGTRGAVSLQISQKSGASSNIINRVSDAMHRSVAWQERRIVGQEIFGRAGNDWLGTETTRQCFACHTQSQTARGWGASKEKLDSLVLNQDMQADMLAAFLHWIDNETSIRLTTESSLWAWGMSSFDSEILLNNFEKFDKGLQFVLDNQAADGSWTASNKRLPYYDGEPTATHTTGNIEALVAAIRALSDAAGLGEDITDRVNLGRDDTETLPGTTVVAGAVTDISATTNISGSTVTLLEAPPETYRVLAATPPETEPITAIKLTVTESFLLNGTFKLEEFRPLYQGAYQFINAGETNALSSTDFGLSFDTFIGSQSVWNVTSSATSATPVEILYILDEPSPVDAFEFTNQPSAALKEVSFSYTTEAGPTLEGSTFSDFTVERVSTGAENEIIFTETPPQDYLLSFDPVSAVTGVFLEVYDSTNFLTIGELEALFQGSHISIESAATTAIGVDSLETLYNGALEKGWDSREFPPRKDVKLLVRFNTATNLDALRLHSRSGQPLHFRVLYTQAAVPDFSSNWKAVANTEVRASGSINEVQFPQREASRIAYEFEEAPSTTAVRIAIDKELTDRESRINEIFILDTGGDLVPIMSASTNKGINAAAPLENAYDGSGSSEWIVGNTSSVVSSLATFVLKYPAEISSIVLVQGDLRYIEKVRFDVTSDPNPTLDSNYQPVSISRVFDASIDTSSTLNYRRAVQAAAESYLNGTIAPTRNLLTAAQALIGLVTALPYLEGETVSRAKASITSLYQQLVEWQNTDGGWGYIEDGPYLEYSTAYPTAVALRAMLLANRGLVDDKVLLAAESLLSQQLPQGPWPLHGFGSYISTTTWVEIALPTVLQNLIDSFQNQSITDLVATGRFEEVKLRWSPLPQAVSYNIFRRFEGNAGFRLIAENHQTNVAEFIDTTVQNETTYVYKVTANLTTGDVSPGSNEASATPFGLVCRFDSPPEIISVPTTGATPSLVYSYQVVAVDKDEGETLTYKLESGPEGMQIDAFTGLLTWTPTSEQEGSHVVNLRVVDSIGRDAVQSYRIFVAEVFNNRAPKFTSSPPVTAAVGYNYRYRAQAFDENVSDILTFSGAVLPEGMTVTRDGLVQWSPKVSALGVHQVVLTVTDAAGESDTQSYEVTVATNEPPAFASTPVNTALRLRNYVYQAKAEDPEGGVVSYRLSEGPEGLVVAAGSGLVTWLPQSQQFGEFTVVIAARDEAGLSTNQTFTITVPQNEPTIIYSTPETAAVVGIPYEQTLDVFDPEGLPLQFALTQGPEGMAVDTTGVITWQPLESDAGTAFPVIVSITDDQGEISTVEYELFVYATESELNGGVNIQVESPESFSQIGKPTAVQGTISVTGPEPLQSWTAVFKNLDGTSSQVIGSGTTPVNSGILGRIDTTVLKNDAYEIVIVAVTQSFTATKKFPIDVYSRLKLGSFDYDITDVTIPIRKLPIDITRRYRTLDAQESGDFGYGWNLGYPGSISDPQKEVAQGAGEPYYPGTRVLMRLPDGTRAGWRFEPEPFLIPYTGLALGFFPRFVPDPGNPYELSVANDLLFFAGGEFFLFSRAYNPNEFVVTSPSRERFYLTEGLGLTKVEDEFGNTLNFTETAITHSDGISIEFERDGENRITRIIDPLNRTFLYEYDDAGDLVSVTDAAGETMRYRYENHLLVEIIDALGQTIQKHVYDEASGRLLEQIDPFGNTTRIDSDINLLKEAITNSRGFTTVSSYDEDGNLIEISDALNNVTKFEYDDNWNLSKTIDALGREELTTYNRNGELLEYVDALGNTTMVSYKDEVNAVGSLSKRFTFLTDAQNNKSQQLIDYEDGAVASLTAEGISDSTFIDSIGQPLFQQDGELTMTQYFYDAKRRLQGIGYLEGDENTNTPDVVVTTRSDGQQSLIRLGDMEVTHEYDQTGRIVRRTNAEGGVVTYSYDENGRLTSFTDPIGNVSSFRYNADGTLKEEIDPLGKVISYNYDTAGNITERVDRLGRRRRFFYDELGRLVREQWVSPDESEVLETRIWKYDAVGNVISAEDSAGRYEYKYDQIDRVLSVSNIGFRYIPDATIAYEYDSLGNQIGTRDSFGTHVLSEYDKDSRLVSQEWFRNGDLITTYLYSYNGRNQVQRVERLKGTQPSIVSQYEFNYQAMVSNIRHQNSSNERLFDQHYSYNDLFRLRAIEENETREVFTYDHTSQLVSKEVENSSNGESFEYDLNGNRIGESITIGKANRLLEDLNFNYTYDFEGNLTEKRNKNSGAVWKYTYDFLNRMTTAESFNVNETEPEIRVGFKYDVNNQRIGIERDDGSTYSLYSRDNVWLDFSKKSEPKFYYLFGNRVDELLARLDTGGILEEYLSDQIGSIRLVVKSRDTVELRKYSVFGESEFDSNSTTRFGFAGREFDSLTGLYYFRARYYDPSTGRFISEDPIGIASRESNFYRYAGNYPNFFVDPWGLDFQKYAKLTAEKIQMAETFVSCIGGAVEFVSYTASLATGAGSAIYIFDDLVRGADYVGESIDYARRLHEHAKAGRIEEGTKLLKVTFQDVAKKRDRRIAEQAIMLILGDGNIDGLANRRLNFNRTWSKAIANSAVGDCIPSRFKPR